MPRFALVIAVVAVSFAAPFIRLAEPASALTVASGRVGLAALLLNVIAPYALRRFWALPPRERWLVVGAGVCLGVHFGVWITSLYYTSTASSVTLVAVQPVFAAVLGRWFLGDAVGVREGVGISIALAGTAVIAGTDWGVSVRALAGDGMALAGAALAAAYYIIGRRMRDGMDLLPYLAVVNLVAAVVLFAAAGVADAKFVGFDWQVYAAIAAAAVVCSMLGHTLLNWSVRRSPAHLVTLAILGEPVGAALLAWALVSEQPPWAAAIGGAIILAGIGVGFSKRSR